MKNRRSFFRAQICATFLIAGVIRVPAEGTVTARPEKSYTGTLVDVEPKNQELCVKRGMLSQKMFALGTNCAFTMSYVSLNSNSGMTDDLRPGEKITVSYQDAQGVLIADRIQQQARQFAGTVETVNPDKHTIRVRWRIFDKHFEIGDDCIVTLRDEKVGTLADLHPGDHVLVAYETPGGRPTARTITKSGRASPAH
jgi:hypothetical protein